VSAPTYVACLTPAGTAAIATIALHGPDAWDLVEPLFHARGANWPDPAQHHRFWLGRLGDEAGDEVVLTIQGEGPVQRVEIHCHGGVAVVRWLLGLLRERGAVETSWEEWLRRTSPSNLQAEAAIALARAPTLRTANILLDQYHGALQRAVREILRPIEEESSSPFVPAARLQALLQWIPFGLHLTQPWRVVLAGAPNVGKSSLSNAILGYQRSIISPLPATTRDVVTALTAIDGWPVELVDTAGVQDRAEGLEAEGMARAKQAGTSADLCLWIADGSQPPVFPADSVPAARLLPVINKVDLPRCWQLPETPWESRDVCCVSALTGEGIPALIDAIARRLVPQVPPAGAAVPFTEDIGRVLLSARDALAAGDWKQAQALLAGLLAA
jgi:tRNA modification GTPase